MNSLLILLPSGKVRVSVMTLGVRIGIDSVIVLVSVKMVGKFVQGGVIVSV